MKKIYAVIGCALLAFGANAQNLQTIPNGASTPSSSERSNPPSTQSMQSFYVDYDYMDEVYNVDSMGGMYARYIWDMNMNYDLTLGDTNITYAVVDFSSFFDSYNANGPTPMPSSTFNSYVIDSVFILGGHENNSGVNDTLIVKIVALNSQGYPQTSNVLHADTVTSTMFGTTNDWLTSAVIGVEVNYPVTSATTRFGVVVEFYGDRTLDTFGILAGFGDLGAGNCAANPTLPNFALLSHYAQNSYRYDMRFSPANGMLPNAAGADTYYECNGTPNKQAGADSENFLQNWGVWARITVDGVGINEEGNTGIALEQNVPNPSNGTTMIRYNIANSADVSLEVYDVTGKLVETVDQGQQVAGQHQVDLNTSAYAPGVYFYTLNVDGVKVTRKMIVTE
ncbi:MAG TPA: T9SS type A sorting domain-containing protein [Bacteroidia bacterium]|nr:T9SS type A sorting domain-containing protein [Bacteroidia bacterium]